MPITFSTEEKKKLLEEFNSLPSIAAKFKFWQQQLGRKYIFFLLKEDKNSKGTRLEYLEELQSLQDFTIEPDPEEAVEYNDLLLKEYKENVEATNPKKKLLDLTKLIQDFNSKLELTKNKEIYINRKRAELDQLINEKSHVKRTTGFSNKRNWFTYGYERYYLDNKEVDTDSRVFDLPQLIEALNGVTTAKYKEYLEEQAERFKDEPKLKKDADQLNLKQQLMILYYLGGLDIVQQAEHTSKKASFLSRLLDKDVQTMRKEVSTLPNLIYATDKLEKERIKKDLTVVKNLFEELGVRNIVRKITVDLLKLG
jgi:hypothetical protein